MNAPEKLSGHRGRFTRRAFLLGAGQVGLMGALGWRLHELLLVEGQKYALLSDENRINVQLIAPERGKIYDRFGELLASNAQSLRVMLVPDLAGDLDDTLAGLARVLPISDDMQDRIRRLARRQSPQIPIPIADNLTWQQFARINLLAPSLPGVTAESGWQRRYHQGADFAHVIGYVGAADKTEVNEDPLARLPGFRVGKTGVEKGFDARLRGKAGNLKVEVNAQGRGIRKLDERPGEPGADVTLTIDHNLQRFALQRLAVHRRAAMVALAVESGEILALASVPTHDPGVIVSGAREESWRALTANEDDPLTNKAIRGQYPPGSTFKVVTALAGLEAGVITPTTRIGCGGFYSLGNHSYRCWRRGGHGDVDVHRAIKESCDVFFYETARRVGIERLSAMARTLGIGQTYDCGLPLQKPGVAPDPAWKRSTLGDPWYPGETVVAGIGQGYVLATPLQLALMTARVASGRKIVPQIVRSSLQPAVQKLDAAPDHLRILRTALSAVVNEPGGTGGSVRLTLPGVQMAGKTGTSQVVRLGRDTSAWDDNDHALFIGYAPVDVPRYAVAAVIEHGGAGSRAAAPVVRDMMLELLRRDPLGRQPEKGPGEHKTAGGRQAGKES